MTSHVQYVESRSPRSVWVEINKFPKHNHCLLVTLPTERVSWNVLVPLVVALVVVTLPTERVSWNGIEPSPLLSKIVTLPTERVSWNYAKVNTFMPKLVTLPTERVSWNLVLPYLFLSNYQSRSPRSVWVEMSNLNRCGYSVSVTLPTERVSWNFVFCFCRCFCLCHAPHGACELKLLHIC